MYSDEEEPVIKKRKITKIRKDRNRKKIHRSTTTDRKTDHTDIVCDISSESLDTYESDIDYGCCCVKVSRLCPCCDGLIDR